MGIRTSITDAVTGVLAPITATGEAAAKTLAVGTKKIDRWSTQQDMLDQNRVAKDTAKELLSIRKELEEDDELATLFNEIKDQFK